MNALRVRNIDTSPDGPVETWLVEGVLTAIEDGPRPDWERLVAAIGVDLGAGRLSTYLKEIRSS